MVRCRARVADGWRLFSSTGISKESKVQLGIWAWDESPFGTVSSIFLGVVAHPEGRRSLRLPRLPLRGHGHGPPARGRGADVEGEIGKKEDTNWERYRRMSGSRKFVRFVSNFRSRSAKKLARERARKKKRHESHAETQRRTVAASVRTWRKPANFAVGVFRLLALELFSRAAREHEIEEEIDPSWRFGVRTLTRNVYVRVSQGAPPADSHVILGKRPPHTRPRIPTRPLVFE